jgi:hypothetical protein
MRISTPPLLLALCLVGLAISQAETGRAGTKIDLGQRASAEIISAPLGVAAKGLFDFKGALPRRRGRVTAVNVTADVTWILEGGLVRQKLRSVDSLLIRSAEPGRGYDMSLMVEDVDTCPKPVGVVHARSETFALAWPMEVYLGVFDITLENGCVAGPSSGRATAADPGALDHARQVKARRERPLFQIGGVIGTGLGLGDQGRVTIEVYVERVTPELRTEVPTELEGLPVRIVETGGFTAP